MSNQDHITITLSPDEADQLEKATGEVSYLLNHAENIFALLYSGVTSGCLDGHVGITSLFELCGRAFRSAAEVEGEAILMLDAKLRIALGERARAELAGQPIYNGGATFDPEQ
ncbi:MAG: hypothetical protein K8F59_10220 [Rhodobacteraceae bacterium]|nr:hypothetical protein [Paracoccaceae bacterium]